MDVNIFQRIGVLLELRIHFHDDVILIELRVNRGDLALAEGVVESIVNVSWENAEPGCGVAVNDDVQQQAAGKTIVCNIAQLRKILQAFLESGNPGVQLFSVDVFQTVLKLRAADAVFDGQVLHRLHEECDAINFVELRLKAANHVAGANFAFGERLQIHLNAAGVKCRVCAINSDEGGKALYRRILQYHVSELPLARCHGTERNGLWRFRNAKNHACVLHGEKTLGNIDVQKNCANESGDRDEQRCCAVAKNDLQRAAVKCNYGIEGVF